MPARDVTSCRSPADVRTAKRLQLHLLTAMQHRRSVGRMSLISARSSMHHAPANAGRMPSRAGGIASTLTTTITTGTGTTGPGRYVVRS